MKTNFAFASLFVLASCGGSEDCELQHGTWDCTFTATATTCSGVVVGSRVTSTAQVDDSSDSCSTVSVNQGPEYIAAQNIYVYMTGSVTGESSTLTAGGVTYRYVSVGGAQLCTTSCDVKCSPRD